jgi:predicted phage tail protein
VDYSKAPRKEGKKGAGAASIVAGILCLTIPFFMASTHTWDGVNYANAFHTTLTIVGSGLILFGLGLGLSDRLALAILKRNEDTLAS